VISFEERVELLTCSLGGGGKRGEGTRREGKTVKERCRYPHKKIRKGDVQ